jgi:hypothetical protein
LLAGAEDKDKRDATTLGTWGGVADKMAPEHHQTRFLKDTEAGWYPNRLDTS